MSSDRSRLSDRPRHLYAGIVAQQGRVILDRDVNELQDIVLSRLATSVRDIVGPSGTPDDGFRISAPNPAPDPGFFSPREPATASPPEAPGGAGDFLIGAGSMYLGGYRVEFPSREDGRTVSYSYSDQPDWPVPSPAAGDLTRELVYLDATLQEVSAVEDPDLLEVALGGPDTTRRLRFVPRVKRTTVDATDCATAWKEAVSQWASTGLAFDPATMRLKPAAKLQVGFTEDAGTGDPCDPTATGGYLGADNQLIRVQVSTAGGRPALIWGYDNASFIYRVTSIAPDGATLTLASDPPDAFHIPQTGQIVEILTTASVVAVEPDETDPAGIRRLVRVAAEAVGEFHELAQPYGPVTQGDPTSYIVLSEAVGTQIAASTLPVFLRVWQARLPLAFDTPIALYDPATQVSTGIEVTLSGASAAADGAYWQIAVRPSTPQAIYPEDLLVRPQPADGPFRLVCPLAVIDWTVKGGPGITDCRNAFDNLVDLTRRKPGCCTVSITPRDLTGGAGFQALVDRAAAVAERVTLCLAAGVYPLAAPLRLGPAHAGLILESCGGPATLQLDAAADAKAFSDGLVVISDAAGVSLAGLTLVPPPAPASAAFDRLLIGPLADATTRAQAASLLLNPRTAFGIRASNAMDLTVDRCTIVFAEDKDLQADDLLGAAIFLQGDCRGFRALDCTFGSTVQPSYTPITSTANTGVFLPSAAVASPAPAARIAAAASTTAAAPDTLDIAAAALGGVNFAAFLANRSAATFARQRRPLRATVGILALPAVGAGTAGGVAPRSTLACALGEAAISGNRFDGLTFGALIAAGFGALRVQDNNLTGGVAGFWVILPQSRDPQDAPTGTPQYFDTIDNFEELKLLTALAAVLPPPAAAAGVPPPAFTGEAAVFVSGNHIATGPNLAAPPPEGTADEGAAIGHSALLLWLATTGTAAATDSDISAIVSANRLVSTDAAAPAALVIMPQLQSCAISGNIIVNRAGIGAADKAPSLWVLMDNQLKVADPIAITGNVLRGHSNLTGFARPGAAARPGWSGYNADPA